MHTNAHESDIKPECTTNKHDAKLSHALGSFSPDSCRFVSIRGFQQVPFLAVMHSTSIRRRQWSLLVREIREIRGSKASLGLSFGFRASDFGFVWFGA